MVYRTRRMGLKIKESWMKKERRKKKEKKKKKIKIIFFFKQKTAYEIYQCDWSSDVCSSDLDWSGLAIYVATSLMVAWMGYWWFQKTRRGFADVL